MRILHVAKSFSTVGGIERYVRDLALAHQERGHHVDVLAVNDSRESETVSMGTGSAFLVPRLFSFQSATLSHRFPWELLKRSGDYDIVHHHFPNPIGEVSEVILRASRGNRDVATFHADVVPSKRFYRLYEPIARRFLDRMDRIVSTSPNQKESSRFLEPYSEKVHVVPLGVPIEPAGSIAGTVMFPDGAHPKILFVGRLGRYKGVDHLLHAMTEAPGHLLVVGKGPREQSLKKRASSHGLDKRVDFLGFLSDANLSAAYEEADILVLPSTDSGEGFGYVLLEAMVHGTALVSTELGTGTSFANLDGETGLVVQPGEPMELAKAIRRLAEDRVFLDRCKSNARARVEHLFSLTRMAKDVEEVYKSAIEESGR